MANDQPIAGRHGAPGRAHPAPPIVTAADRLNRASQNTVGRLPTLQAQLADFVDALRLAPSPQEVSRLWSDQIESLEDKALSTRLNYLSRYRTEVRSAFGDASPFLQAMQTPPAWDLQQKAQVLERVSAPSQLVDVREWRALQERARELLQSADPLDIGVGLIAVTGRRPVEVFTLGIFEKVEIERRMFARWAVSFEGQAKTRGKEGTRFGQAYVIPTLAPAGEVVDALSRLRSHEKAETELVVDAGEIRIVRWAELSAEDFQRALLRNGELGRRIAAQLGEFWPADRPGPREKGGPMPPKTDLTAHNLRSLYAEIAHHRFAADRVSKHSFFAVVLGNTTKDLDTSLAGMKFVVADDGQEIEARQRAEAKREALQGRLLGRLEEIGLAPVPDAPDVHGDDQGALATAWTKQLLELTDVERIAMQDRKPLAAPENKKSGGSYQARELAAGRVQSAPAPKAQHIRQNNLVLEVEKVDQDPSSGAAPTVTGVDLVTGERRTVALMTPEVAAQTLSANVDESMTLEQRVAKLRAAFEKRPSFDKFPEKSVVAFQQVYSVSGSETLQAKWPVFMRGADNPHEMVKAGLLEITYREFEGKRLYTAGTLNDARVVPLMSSELNNVTNLFSPLERDGSVGRQRFFVAVQYQDGRMDGFNWHQASATKIDGVWHDAMQRAAYDVFKVDPETHITKLASNEELEVAKRNWLKNFTYGQDLMRTSAMAAAVVAGVLSRRPVGEVLGDMRFHEKVTPEEREAVRAVMNDAREGRLRAAIVPGASYRPMVHLASRFASSDRDMQGVGMWPGAIGISTFYTDAKTKETKKMGSPMVHAVMSVEQKIEKMKTPELARYLIETLDAQRPDFAALKAAAPAERVQGMQMGG